MTEPICAFARATVREAMSLADNPGRGDGADIADCCAKGEHLHHGCGHARVFPLRLLIGATYASTSSWAKKNGAANGASWEMSTLLFVLGKRRLVRLRRGQRRVLGRILG
jgi:hypothetical protein